MKNTLEDLTATPQIKMSIITTIQTMTSAYSFDYLWDRKYSDLVRMRDLALINYNKQVRK
jgi:hypothetical protein